MLPQDRRRGPRRSVDVCPHRPGVRLLSATALVSLCCLGGAAFAQAPGSPPAPDSACPQAQPQPAPARPARCRPSTWKPPRRSPPRNRRRGGRRRNRRDPAPKPSKPSRSARPRRRSAPSPRATDLHRGRRQFGDDRQDIQKLPQAENSPVSRRCWLNAPRVSQDLAAASGSLHVRNEHANVAYRLNGIMLPDGVSGLGAILEELLSRQSDAAHRRAAGRVRAAHRGRGRHPDPGGRVRRRRQDQRHGGSHDTFTTADEYGGTIGGDCRSVPPSPRMFVKAPPPGACGPVTEYFFTGRYYTSNLGIEIDARPGGDPRPHQAGARLRLHLDHHRSDIARELHYRASLGKFQISEQPGPDAAVAPAFWVTNFDSSRLDENGSRSAPTTTSCRCRNRSTTSISSFFISTATAACISSSSSATSCSTASPPTSIAPPSPTACRATAPTRSTTPDLATGFSVTSEKTQNTNLSTVEPCMICDGTDNEDAPFTVNRSSIAKSCWPCSLCPGRVEDHQPAQRRGPALLSSYQYVNANQPSLGLSVVYQPLPGTTFHAGYARYFTPPPQAIAALVNIAAFANTTAQPSLFLQVSGSYRSAPTSTTPA